MANEPLPDQVNSTPPPLNGHGAARRRLAKAGVGAAGVLWTLESKATYGKGFMCETPSAAVSVGASANVRDERCGGLPPHVWCTIGHWWPCSDKIKFSTIFRCKGSHADTYGQVSMMDLLAGKNFDSSGVGRELSAAFLNVMAGKVNVVSVETLKEMWWDLQNGGYSPKPGTIWNARGLSKYLSSTHY